MEYAVAFMIGTSAVVIGLSCLLHADDWRQWLKFLQAQGKPAALGIGYLHLLVGTFILGFHWKWEGLPLLLTLLGVKALLEGVIYTLSPNTMLAMLRWYEPRPYMFFRIAGLITIVIGLAVLHEWWEFVQTQDCLWQPCFNQAAVQ